MRTTDPSGIACQSVGPGQDSTAADHQPWPAAGLTAFSFGYDGWGPHTEKLIRAFDAVERSRGYEPPLVVDTRIRRNVRAIGFRGTAFEEKLGDRHRWLRELGNRNVLTGEDGITIDHPEAAKTLLSWIREEADQRRRVIFFCSCGPVDVCHRQAIATLLLEEANLQGIDLGVAEWPGGGPRAIRIPVPTQRLRQVAKGRKWLPVSQAAATPGEHLAIDPELLGLPWFSLAVLDDGTEELPILTGPAAFSGEWALPVLELGHPAETGFELSGRAEGIRAARGYGVRRAKLVDVGQIEDFTLGPVHPFCLFHIRHSRKLREIASSPGGMAILEEKGNWKSAAALLRDAQSRGERLLILFDHAEEFVGIGWVAEVKSLEVLDHGDGVWSASLAICGLRELPTRIPRASLRLKSTGRLMDPGYLRGKLICQTPKFFFRT